MLLQLGRFAQANQRLGASISIPVIPGSGDAILFDFTTQTLPSELTYTRNDNAATVRNAAGKLVAVSANTPRFDHDESGNALGLRIEPPSTNKCENTNVNPTNTNGLTLGGDANATISVVDAPAGMLEDANLDALCTNGKVFFLNNASGSSTAYVDIAGVAGNTNTHSISIFAAVATAGYSGTITIVGAGSNQAITSAQMQRLKLEGIAPNATSRQMRINVVAGRSIYFILNQFEEMPFCTSPIRTQGQSAARARELCSSTDLANVDWFNETAGAMVADITFDHTTGIGEQYPILASQGTGFNNALALYVTNNAAAQIRARDVANGVNQHTNDIHKPIPKRRFPIALSWNASQSFAVAGPMRYNQESRVTASGITNLYIGGRPFNSAMSGWVKSVKIYNTFRSVEELGADMIPQNNVRGVISGGQSNKHGFFRSQIGQLNSGEVETLNQFDQYWTTSENWLINGAENGSFTIKQNDANADNQNANWWYDPVTDGYGPRMDYWETVANAFGTNNILAIDWDQGGSDAGSSVAELETAWFRIFERMREVVGDKPVIITPIGRRSDFQSTGYNNLRTAQQQLAAENSWIHLTPEKFIYDLSDNVHLTDEGYGLHGSVMARKILSVLGEPVSGGVDGPEITGATRSGTTITVTITQDSGTDFTPQTNIEGFKMFDNGAEIAINSAVRTNATTITLTLASAPSGTETLYYGFGTMIDQVSTYQNFVTDNATPPLPLRATVLTL